MNELSKIFNFEDTKVHIVTLNNEPYFEVYSVGNIRADGSNSSTRYNIFGATNSTSNTTITKITIRGKALRVHIMKGCLYMKRLIVFILLLT